MLLSSSQARPSTSDSERARWASERGVRVMKPRSAG
jgi:hypothetical protein